MKIMNKFKQFVMRGNVIDMTKECPFCCSTIAIKAIRCPNCTSQF